MNDKKTITLPEDLKQEGIELARELRSLDILQDRKWKTMSELRALLRQNPQKREYYEQIIVRRIKLGTAMSEYKNKLKKAQQNE